MTHSQQDLDTRFNSSSSAIPIVICWLLLIISMAGRVQAQTFSVLHTFSGVDGAQPYSGVTLDQQGNLYGTTSTGAYGVDINGTVYELSPSASGWVLKTLYRFQNGIHDGAQPLSGVVFGPDGWLYGTTVQGGSFNCEGNWDIECGTAYQLRRPLTCNNEDCFWNETVIHFFQWAYGCDGAFPQLGNVVFDSLGNIYGTTSIGGCSPGDGAGIVFELTPEAGGSTRGSWIETTTWNFDGNDDGNGSDRAQSPDTTTPFSGVLFQGDSVLYGTTTGSGGGAGAVYQLTRFQNGWSEGVIHAFENSSPQDGNLPLSGLIADSAGNLYGTTSMSGAYGGGTVFELSPFGEGWNFKTLYALTGNYGYEVGPHGNLVIDGSGNLYGTTALDGAYGLGSVFKLTPNGDGTWTYTTLHDFTGGADGSDPWGALSLDNQGDLFGTARYGGDYNDGVVFEITP